MTFDHQPRALTLFVQIDDRIAISKFLYKSQYLLKISIVYLFLKTTSSPAKSIVCEFSHELY